MRFVKFLTFLAFWLVSAVFSTAEGQSLPTVPRSSAVKVGTLPSRVSYYLAPNNSTKGYANFVLVQKGNSDKDRSRELLMRQGHFDKCAPYEFLASKGVGYGPEGFISYPDGNTVFTFQDVPMFDSAASDSTILLLFDLIQAYEGEQAIVVAGDIKPADVESKLGVLSLTVTPRKEVKRDYDYKWEPNIGPAFTHTENNTGNLAEITFIWNAPRTPYDKLNTPQPLISYMYAGELQFVVEKRVRRRFYAAGIPVAGFSSRYHNSSESSGDERYEFSVSMSRDRLEEATALFAAIFAELDADGASLAEFADAKLSMMTSTARSLSSPISNSALAWECVASFLYGTTIFSTEAAGEFFAKREIDPELELSLFNGFVSALLDPRRALEIRCDTPVGSLDNERVLNTFGSAWNNALAEPRDESLYRVNNSDTLSFLVPKGRKVSVKSTTRDPVTGGSIWTFSNGVRVVYKRTAQKGIVNYSLLLKGGYSYIKDIGPGESAFVGDALGLFKVAGLDPMDFSNMLMSNGIQMRGEGSLTDVKILGSAPSGKLDLLMKALLSYAHDRKVDERAFDYYRECERLRAERTRLSRDGIIAAIDSTMCPDYYYPTTKSVERLMDDFPQRLNTYLNDEFAKFSDGLMVIIGDISEEQLQAVLGRYLGHFQVSSDFSVRPKVEYNLRPGWSTYNVEAANSSIGSGEVCVNVGMATLQPFTTRSYFAFLIACSAMKRSITEAIAPAGVYADVSVEAQVFPAEKLTFYVTCRPCDPDGLPAGVSPAEPYQILRALRKGISSVSLGGLTEKELGRLKSAMNNTMATLTSNPEFLTYAVMMRNSECKDIVSYHSSAIDAVTLADVNGILHNLDFGSKVEFIIR